MEQKEQNKKENTLIEIGEYYTEKNKEKPYFWWVLLLYILHLWLFFGLLW